MNAASAKQLGLAIALLGLLTAGKVMFAAASPCYYAYARHYLYEVEGHNCRLTISDRPYLCAEWEIRTNCIPDPNYPFPPYVCDFLVYNGFVGQGGECNFYQAWQTEGSCWPKTTEDCDPPSYGV